MRLDGFGAFLIFYFGGGRAHIRRLHPDWAARPALMRRAAHAVESDFFFSSEDMFWMKRPRHGRQPGPGFAGVGSRCTAHAHALALTRSLSKAQRGWF
jgi:hypothetical protein